MQHAADEVKIRTGCSDEIIELRQEILRFGMPRKLAQFDGDDEPTTRHVVAEIGGAIVGCATVMRRDWNDQSAWQLRGMAVAKVMQGRGIGAMLLDEIERMARDENYSNQFWCKARIPAARFYQMHGWQIASAEFFVEHAGPHVKMTKWLGNPNDETRNPNQ